MAENPDRDAAPEPVPGTEPPTVAIPPGGTAHEDFGLQAVPDALPFEDGGDESVPFGDYELLGELGRGGMGVVYRARERHSGRIVALKMMLSEAGPKPHELRRFRLEARAAGQLSHPGIVSVHSWGEHDKALFYTMDYVPGVPLVRLMVKGRLPADRAVRYLVGIARAVAAAHAQGIVHRDLKPGNVIIDPHDQPRVLDFGLAKRQQAVTGEASGIESIVDVLPADTQTVNRSVPDTDSRFQRVTRAGTIVGTPTYMAPEQASGAHDEICPATDVHALGAILYEMLMGRPPYQGGSVMETLLQVRQREPDAMWVEGQRVPKVLEEVCLRCLQKKPRDRYPDAGALADDLETRWERAAQARRFAWLAVGAGAAGLLLGYLGLLSARQLWPATGESAVERSLLGQAVWLTALILFGAALLALSTSLAALGGWVWRASRAWRVLLVGAGALVAAAGAVSLGESVAYFGLAVYAMLAAGVAGITWLARATYHSEQVGNEAPSSVRTEPFLHRLLGRVGGIAAPARKAAPTAAAAPVATGLADIEKGKVIQRWETGEVWRGRQKTLERPVLVWLDRTPAAPGAPLPGVYVRHPSVLVLHAVGVCPEGRYVVTEFTTGTPLAEFLQRQKLSAQDAVQLAVALAEALQAVHDQEACTHDLRPERIVLRGGLEPALCPWCLPSQAVEDRVRDCQALGRMLLAWLATATLQPFAVVQAVANAAVAGQYTRPADLAQDLALALQDSARRARSRRTSWLIVLLTVVPWLALLLGRLTTGESLMPFLISALIPATILLGYHHARTVVWLLRFRYSVPLPLTGRALRWLPVQLAVTTLPPALMLRQGGTGLLASALLLGYWILGACLGGLATLGGFLLRTLRPRQVGSPSSDENS